MTSTFADTPVNYTNIDGATAGFGGRVEVSAHAGEERPVPFVRIASAPRDRHQDATPLYMTREETLEVVRSLLEAVRFITESDDA